MKMSRSTFFIFFLLSLNRIAIQDYLNRTFTDRKSGLVLPLVNTIVMGASNGT